MIDTQAVKESFGRAAGTYDAHADLQREVRDYTRKAALQYWPKKGNILDAGCGTSALYNELKHASPALTVYGLDISLGMCRHSQSRHAAAANADAEAMPFSDEVFDGIFSSLMLQWANHPEDAFSEMARVLKPGCHVVISTLASGTLMELKDAFAAIDDYPHVSHFEEPHSLLANAEATGFSLVVANQNKIVEYYPDTIALMRALQAIGASNKHAARRKGLMTPAKFAKLEAAYNEWHIRDKGLPASWQVLTLVLRKDAL